MVLSLNGNWKLKQVGGSISCDAKVPGCNFTALLDNKLIKDPFVSTNEKEMGWVGESDWEYSRDFDVTEDIINSNFVILECKMLDTLATIYINDTEVATTDNCFIEHEFDIKKYLFTGRNHISILFKSPVEYVRVHQKEENVPRNNNGQNGIPHIRKPQCHFGWDWGPVLVPSGITKDIFISFGAVRDIEDIEVVQQHSSNMVKLSISTGSKDNEKHDWQISLFSPEGKLIDKKEVTATSPTVEMEVVDPKLWWTYELNKVDKQPLYTVEAIIVDGGKELTKRTAKIGLRTITLNRDKDEYGSNFCFMLNGVPIFAKGANWIPADSFNDRVDNNKIDFYLNSARYANLNMIRIWGGGYYGDEYFYNKCDEMGILIWQDFMFACQPYPVFIDSLLQNILNEVKVVVKRIKIHPSLALWCGNNELEAMDIAWRNRPKYIKWTETFFYHILKDEVTKYDGITPYIPGSPVGIGYQKGVGADNVGDTHLWAVWHGLQPLDYYRKRMTRFCSEYGFESLPDLKTIEYFAKKEDYNLNSPVFLSHQKCACGNGKMKYYVASRFYLPTKFEDYVYLSQICQLECIRDATEHWRRNKGRCNGSMYWQFNDCWPVCSWSSIDYFGNYKALHYGAKHFNSPVGLSILNNNNKVTVYITNDTLQDKNLTLTAKLVTFDGNNEFNFNKEIAVENGKVVSIDVLDISSYKNIKDMVFYASIVDNGKVVEDRTLLFDKEKNLSLPKADVEVRAELVDDEVRLTLTSKKFAHYVAIYHKTNTNPFSDNYFDLLPNETKVVTIKYDNTDLDFTVTTTTDIQSDKNKFKDNFERFKVFIEPINFFQYIYNMFVPPNCKVK